MTTSGPGSAPVRLPPGYEFVRMLGRGGNGYVVSARQLDLDRLVAVKMIIGGALAAGGVARLQREGRALARLRHPNIVRVFAAVPMADDLALVLELVQGESLESALKANRLGLAETLVVLADIAAAVQHCADNGIVHRDLKPANILLTTDGRAKVADFGIARISRTAAAFRTSTGIASGTPLYMAPEQLLDPDREDPAGDAFSFAVIAYRALTGEFPFADVDSDGSFYVVATRRPTLLGSLEPEVRQAFEAALSAEPVGRLGPQGLLECLKAAPPSAWPCSNNVRCPSPPEGDEEVRSLAHTTDRTRVDYGPPRGTIHRAPEPQHSPDAIGGGGSTASWLDVPVFTPGRRKRSVASSPKLVGLVSGLIVALLLATMLALR